MNKRKLLIGLLVVGLLSVGFGAAVYPASADQRTFTVTLVTGQVMTVTLDVAPGTPLDQIHVPGVSTPIVGISEVGAPSATTTTAPPATTGTTPPPATTGAQPPSPATDQPAPASQGSQETTGKAVRKARPHHEALGAVQQVPGTGAVPDGSKAPGREPDGAPTPANPTYSFALPGPAPIGVPNFFIEKFRIPPFLLPIYQAAGIQYGVRWELLAAINEIETEYGRNLSVSTKGAVGWMQFLPSTWERYGVDANSDHRKDPYNPVDAIFAAARYLKAAGADTDVRNALFAYNHASWYVDSVLLRARLIGGVPSDLVGSLTGLTQGHFPVHAKARYADDVAEAKARKVKPGQNAAVPVEANAHRKGIDIYAKAGSPVIAVQDGKIVNIGSSPRLGTFIQLRDVYGNTYTYGDLKKVAKAYPVPKDRKESKAQIARELKLPKADPMPTAPATAGNQRSALARSVTKTSPRKAKPAPRLLAAKPKVAKERLFANPGRPAAYRAGGEDQLLEAGVPVSKTTTFRSYFTQVFGLKRSDVVLKRLKVGSKVVAGTILGRIGKVDPKIAPHTHFEIRPAGKDAPRIDPKPILDGWKLLETTAIYRAAGKNPFFGPDAKDPTIGQVLLMSKEALTRRVLIDPNVDIYGCGQRDVRAGTVDQRVLATLEFLSASGLKPTVTSLRCGHSFRTAEGNVSEHSAGDAVDIAAINGIPIAGHQGPGSITDITIRRLLTLQGTLKPHQIISLMTFDGADNTLALPDHADHIHVGFRPLYGTNGALGQQAAMILKPGQWTKLIDRLGHIDNPVVRVKPSKYSITVANGNGD
jgi:Transglycosylase SLT domain/Peptidase family M23